MFPNMFVPVLAFFVLLFTTCGQCQDHRRILGQTRIINTKQGKIQGLVVEPKYNQNLNNVQVFLGIPYAAPPVGSQRFMPPATPPQWPGLFIANTLSPVCPQDLPDFSPEAQRKMPAGRFEYLARLLPYLKNQSEDCLYLNIYAPERKSVYESPKLPVIVFIHGESFQWNSGNPYDGSVLAGYGNVIVVTINFRLGILGFLRPGVGDHTPSNFGLLDQLAALQWIKDNIAAFDGDEDNVTLMGHGTGAACVNYLMVSPVSQGATGLFHRAILMSGTALADWALTTNPIQYTIQVAEDLNCPESSSEMANCLRRKRLHEIMGVKVRAPPFRTPFGPVIDGTVVPNEPAKLMTIYKDLFLRYEMLYGMTETESYHLLDSISLANGMLEEDSTQLLKDYFRAKYEVLPDVAMAKTLRQYNHWYTGTSTSAAEEHRDKVLEILSDARVAAPLVQTATYHSQANPKSYFYIFKHRSKYGVYPSISKSVHGEELPYVFGVPLDGASFAFDKNYNLPERLLSEVIMTLWCNFAKHGNPNIHRRREYITQGMREWQQYDIEWPEYNTVTQPYYSLGVPASIGHFYRRDMMNYWNHQLPEQLKNPSPYEPSIKIPPTWVTSEPPRKSTYPLKPILPPIYRTDSEIESWNPRYHIPYEKTARPTESTIYGNYPNIKPYHLPPRHGHLEDGPKEKPEKPENPSNHETQNEETEDDGLSSASSVALSIVILVGICFLVVNLCAFIGLYYQRDKLKVRERIFNTKYTCDGGNAEEDIDDRYMKNDDPSTGELTRDLKNTEIKSILKSSEGIYEPVKATSVKTESSGGCSRKAHRWTGISRQASSSTMTVDPHTKVREWIAQEIVHKCSPRFLRRNKKLELKNDSTDTYVDQLSSNTMDSNLSRLGTLQKPKVKKVSVAVDATPATRSPSILQQTPIELTKSLDDGKSSSGLGSVKPSTSMMTILKRPSLQRSDALNADDYDDTKLRKSSTSINLKLSQSTESMPTVVHYHSASDPVTSASSDIISGISKINYIHLSKEKVGAEPVYSEVKKPKKGDSNTTLDMDVNVTSRDELVTRCSQQHTAEEALDHIKRRNYPKVLPDLPDNSEFNLQKAVKRRSLPLSTLLSSSEAYEEDSDDVQNELPTFKVPPPPPPRVSTLGRKPSNTSPLNATHISVRLKTCDTKTQLPGPVKPPNVPTLSSPIRPAPPQQQTTPQAVATRKPEPKIIIKPTSVNPVTKHDNRGHSNIPRVTHHVPPPENPNKVSTRDLPSTSTKAAVSSTSKLPEMGIGKRTKINPVKKTVSTETTSSAEHTIPNTGTVKRAKI